MTSSFVLFLRKTTRKNRSTFKEKELNSKISRGERTYQGEREQEMLYQVIQTCVLMKLLGAGSDSGRLKISELSALLEDAWVLAVPVNGVRVSQMLAQLRFCLLQQVIVFLFFFLIHIFFLQ